MDISLRSDRPKLLYFLTSPISLRLIRGQVEHMLGSGYDVEIVCGDDDPVENVPGKVPIHVIPMGRRISPWKDLLSLWHATLVLRRIRPDIVNLSTPKAALVGSLACSMGHVRARVYVMRGLRFETTHGLKRFILKRTEELTCRLANRVIAVSSSLKQKAVESGVVRKDKIVVLGAGSSNGVESSRFERTSSRLEAAETLRQQLGISQSCVVIGFVGRFTRDKGLCELIASFHLIKLKYSNVKLLLVGDFDPVDPIHTTFGSTLSPGSNVICTGFVRDIARFYHVMDVLVLPTHREGFPNVVLEAQAASVPVITTNATGAVDSVSPETGITVPVGDVNALSRALEDLITDPNRRAFMGRAGRERVAQLFQPANVWRALELEYRSLLTATTRIQTGWRLFLKRCLDRVVAAALLVSLSPVWLMVALLVRLDVGTPVLFSQKRPGFQGRPFFIRKFRTMSQAIGIDGKLLGDGDRLTPLGRILRSLSLDELPQLWNILRGELSLVGPRPLLMEYLERYTPEQAQRHDVLPGITGWAQVNGRNAISWEDKFRHDLWYVNHWSLWLDFKILLMTVWRVVRREGTTQPGFATAEEYFGDQRRASHES